MVSSLFQLCILLVGRLFECPSPTKDFQVTVRSRGLLSSHTSYPGLRHPQCRLGELFEVTIRPRTLDLVFVNWEFLFILFRVPHQEGFSLPPSPFLLRPTDLLPEVPSTYNGKLPPKLPVPPRQPVSPLSSSFSIDSQRVRLSYSTSSSRLFVKHHQSSSSIRLLFRTYQTLLHLPDSSTMGQVSL